ncbi:hypothetical protein [Vibrio paucivorans]|uniref:Uncharacterized protein n=1 Tax=Vibrio paucivorans TaxID=2829489 RepID=A0A9X3CIV7_9VIBR|nr:hypothetical protein [Vibrio paucivorans]MCW8336607.1 hypothetical protein [Vibrio paucivorans]
MASIKLTQDTVLKHFEKRTPEVPINSDNWISVAQNNHLERGGNGNPKVANTNTLLFVNVEVWESICDGSYFGAVHDQIGSGQIALTIDSQDLDRIITTTRDNGDYSVVYDSINEASCPSATFLCGSTPILVGGEQQYEIVHFEGLGN